MFEFHSINPFFLNFPKVENEINALLIGQLSAVDDEELERELAALMGETVNTPKVATISGLFSLFTSVFCGYNDMKTYYFVEN